MTPYQKALFQDITSIDTLTEAISALDDNRVQADRNLREIEMKVVVMSALRTIWDEDASYSDKVVQKSLVGELLLDALIKQAKSNIDDDWHGEDING